MGGWFFLAFGGLSASEYADILDIACNQYAMEKAVVDACPSLFVLRQWFERRRRVLESKGGDWRTSRALM